MPKEVWKIDKFEGGVNDYTDPKDIKGNEFVELKDVSVAKVGQLKNLGKPVLSTVPTTHNIASATDSGIIPGDGLYRLVNDYSFNTPFSSCTVAHTVYSTDGTKSNALFSIENLLWIVPTGPTDAWAGNALIQLKVETTNLMAATKVLDLDPTNNADSDTLLDEGFYTESNLTSNWLNTCSTFGTWGYGAFYDLLGYTSDQLFGGVNRAFFGFYTYQGIYLPKPADSPVSQLEWYNRRSSLLLNLAIIIEAYKGTSGIGATLIGSFGQFIRLESTAVGTTNNNKQITAALTNNSDGSPESFPAVDGDLLVSNDVHNVFSANNGFVTFSGETEMSGGTDAVADIWTIDLENNIDGVLYLNINMINGTVHNLNFSIAPSTDIAANRNAITTIINNLTGIGATYATDIITITASSTGISNGFTLTAHIGPNLHIAESYDFGTADEQYYFLTRDDDGLAINDSSAIDIYGNSLDTLYPHLLGASGNEIIEHMEFYVFTTINNGWLNIFGNSDTSSVDGGIFNKLGSNGWESSIWKHQSENGFIPNPIFVDNSGVLRMCDGNFKLPNYNHFVSHIDNSSFFPDYTERDADGNAVERESGYSWLYPQLNRWWIYASEKRWSFSEGSHLNPHYSFDGFSSDNDSNGLQYDTVIGIDANDIGAHQDDARMMLYWPYGKHAATDGVYGVDGSAVPSSVLFHKDSNWEGTIRLYASAVYNDGSESLPSHKFMFGDVLQEHVFGSYPEEDPTAPEKAGYNQFPAFIIRLCPYYQAQENPSTVSTADGLFIADPRVTGIRIYYTHDQESHGIYWSMGLIDFSQGWIPEDSVVDTSSEEEGDTDSDTLVEDVIIPASGRWRWRSETQMAEADGELENEGMYISCTTNTTSNTGEWMTLVNPTSPMLDEADTAGLIDGNYYGGRLIVPSYTMPKVRSYDTINGYSPFDIGTTSCRYRAATFAGKRLFVGNIEVVENGVKKYYNDRMLFSQVEKFDTIPYPKPGTKAGNIMDVDISDGDDIIALASTGGKILQWKRRTLYIVDINSGMPETWFVSDRFRHRGLMHKNHWCDTNNGIFWFNEMGAWIYDGEDIKDLFVNEDDEPLQQRINPETWSNFVNDKSICGFHPESREVVIIRKNEQNIASNKIGVMTPLLTFPQIVALASALNADNTLFDFADGSTNLVNTFGFTASNATFVNDDGEGRLSNTASEYGYVTLPLMTEIGKSYDLQFDVTLVNSTTVEVSLGTTAVFNSVNSAVSGVATGINLGEVFKATSTISYLTLQLTTNTSGHYVDVDNLMIYEVSGHTDGDMYVYNVVTNSWTMGDGRAHIGHTSGVKELTNIINTGAKYELSYAHTSPTNDNISSSKIWNYKGENTDNFHVITKITNLGTPNTKKSILGLIINVIQNTAGSVYQLDIFYRAHINDSWIILDSISSTYDATINNNTIKHTEHKLIFNPPVGKDISNIQLKIEGMVQGDFGINDLSIVFRKYRDSSINIFSDE